MQPPPSALPAPTEDALAHSQALNRSIAEEIERAGGWISFARYMDLALYAPALGYYTGGATKLGATGDFVTAPELSPLFSAALARQLAQVLHAVGGGVLELGAGSGHMAADVLVALAELECVPERYAILEVSPVLRALQQQCIAGLPPALRERVVWLERLPDAFTGAVVANELLDALPVHLVVWGEPILERGVACHGGALVFADRRLQAGRLRDAAARIDAARGYVSEIGLVGSALVESLAGTLRAGLLLIIDYGFGASEYYHPQRSRGTLMCHYRHRVHDDPFFLPGLQDITAHVDFSAIARAATCGGLALAGYTSQAHFLVNLGLLDLLARGPPEAPAYPRHAAQAQKLLSPAEMGELFKAIAFTRGAVPPLAGFARGDLSRLL